MIHFNKLIFRILSKSVSIVLPGAKENYPPWLKKLRMSFAPNLFENKMFIEYVNRKSNGFRQKICDIKTLAIRGSNADYGFFAPVWDRSYNLGLVSSDLYYSFQLYQNFGKQLVNLEQIILFYSVSANGYSLIKTSERYRAVVYKYFFEIPYAETGIIKPKFEKYIFKKCETLNHNLVESSYCGYDEHHNMGLKLPASERIKPHLRENRREPDQLNWLNLLCNEIKKDKRKIFIVIPPFRSDYRALLPEKEVLFKKLFQKKLANCEIIDLFDSPDFDDSDFADTDHMNKMGAIKLTSYLKKRIQNKNIVAN